MIIFYDKKTGDIVGTMGGRINSPEEHKMFFGETEDQYGKLSIQWEPTAFTNDPVTKQKVATNFKAKHPQSDLFDKIEKDLGSINNYKVHAGRLVAKNQK